MSAQEPLTSDARPRQVSDGRPLRRLRSLPELLVQSVRLVWEAGRAYVIAALVLQTFLAASLTAQLFLAKFVFAAVLDTSDPTLASMLPWFGGAAVLSGFVSLARALQTELARLLSEVTAKTALEHVVDVSIAVDLIEFENSDFYDRLARAQAQGSVRAMQMVNGLIMFMGSLLSSIGIFLALAAIQPLLLPLVIFTYIPLWLASARNSRDSYRFSWGTTPTDRKRSYLQQLLLDRGTAKEIRSFQLAPFLRRRYLLLFDERVKELKALARRRARRSLWATIGSSGLSAATMIAVAWIYTSGGMTLAATGAAVFGLYQLSNRLAAMHSSVASLYETALFVQDFTSFVRRPPTDRVPARFHTQRVEPLVCLEADRVSFTYPDAPGRAVDEVSIELRAGEIIALVGENGSGKTTLAKMLAGLYSPSSGAIRWNHYPLSDFDIDDFRSQVAVIFQDFVRYLLTVGENVAVGRHERHDDRIAIQSAAEHAGAGDFISRLSEGYDTRLGREFFGGLDLSGGQWQLLALARAFFRDASLVILDEPTAALDARAEANLFARMRDLLDGRSAILISHRFSSVRSADRIYVLERGSVIEEGDHDRLLRYGGKYAELFSLQAAAYQGKVLRD